MILGIEVTGDGDQTLGLARGYQPTWLFGHEGSFGAPGAGSATRTRKPALDMRTSPIRSSITDRRPARRGAARRVVATVMPIRRQQSPCLCFLGGCGTLAEHHPHCVLGKPPRVKVAASGQAEHDPREHDAGSLHGYSAVADARRNPRPNIIERLTEGF
jgi:hypothetical protein